MAAKKKTTKKAAPKKDGQSGGTATLDKPVGTETNVEELPKGQTRGKDGNVILRNGEHNKLPKATYKVHGSPVELEGDVFVAQRDVNWIPTAKCTCKHDRPEPVEIRKLADGCWAVFGTCANDKCGYKGKRYLWVCPANRFRI